jgi:transposase
MLLKMSRKPPIRSALGALREQPDRLIQIILDQAELIAQLQADIEQLKKDNDDLNRRLQEAQRGAKRQAAPFRLEERKRKEKPKKPGRKGGHHGAHREKPRHIDESIEVALPCCPGCGGCLSAVEPLEQFIEEIPPVRPHVTRLVTFQGACAKCGPVRSTHPLQVSTARGAAKTHLGPNALGVALELTKRHGLTVRKACGVLRDLFGLRLSPGGLVKASHRMAGKLKGQYDALATQAKHSSVIHADETSWWVGEPKWWLWVFTNPALTLYRVRRSRGREVLYETLGAEYGGALVSDCLSVYDGVCRTQQKCYAHHLKAISQAIEQHPRQGKGFLRELKVLLKAAMALKKAQPFMPQALRAQARRSLDDKAARMLGPPRRDAREEAIANRLRKQQDHLFTFLDHPDVEATNNLAERQLRPAVIARKLSCGNRTERGAATWEILASIAATAAQAGNSFRDIVSAEARLQSQPAAR